MACNSLSAGRFNWGTPNNAATFLSRPHFSVTAAVVDVNAKKMKVEAGLGRFRLWEAVDTTMAMAAART